MVVHTCHRCGYCTKYKNNLREHYKKKNVCNPVVSDVSIDECLSKLDKKNRYVCKYCDKDFMYNGNLNRHIVLCQESHILELEKENRILKKEVNTVNNTNCNNTDNSINIDASQKIYINSYKDTDLKLVKDDIEKLKLDNKKNIDVIAMLLKVIHFNEKYPENHNLYVENASTKRVMKLENGRFNEDGRGDRAIEKILKNDIDSYIESELLDTPLYGVYEDLMVYYNNLDADDRDNRKEKNDSRSEILEVIRNVLYSGRTVVKDTAKNNGIKC